MTAIINTFSLSGTLSTSYRKDIEGLRAIAVLLVILCHASSSLLSGGFIGVDVFFVISGYVVTKSILPTINEKRFSFVEFYGKRCKRLIPSLFIVCSSVFLYALLFNDPEYLRFNTKNIAFIFGFISNIFQSKNTGYFATESRSIPLLHIWSLSIEEQFYLLLPATLFFIHKKHRITTLFIIFLFSLTLAEHLTLKAPGTSYFSFPARIFEFIPGVLIALIKQKPIDDKDSAISLFVLNGSIILLFYCAIKFNQFTPFPSWHSTLPVLSTATIIYFNNSKHYLYKILSTKPCVHIGKISYCLYLWHWPVFVAMDRAGFGGSELLLAGIPCAYALALLTSFFIETPIRNIKMSGKRSILIFIVAPLLISLSLVAIGKNTNNFEFLYDNATQKINQTGRETIWEDKRTEKCWVQVDFKLDGSCMIGDLKSSSFGILWGDSHAYHLVDFVDLLAKQLHIKLMDHAYSMCPPVKEMSSFSSDPVIAKNDRSCNTHNINTIKAILNNNKIRYVAISATWITYMATVEKGRNIHGFKNGEFNRKFIDTITTLVNAGKKIIIFNDIPYLKKQLIDCTLKNSLPLAKKIQCNYSTEEINKDQVEANKFLTSLPKQNKEVFTIDTFSALCKHGICNAEYKKLPIYKNGDYGHLNRYGSKSLFYLYLERNHENMSALKSFVKR